MKYILSFFILAQWWLAESCNASLYSDRIKPTVQEGFDRTGLLILSAGGLATALVHQTDHQDLRAVQKKVKLSKFEQNLGDVLGSGVPGGITALAQYYYRPAEGRSHISALIFTGLSTFAIKIPVNRERPNGGKHSMPSGHTSTIFATATSLTYDYGWPAAVIGYGLGAFVMLHRVAMNAHWPSDTVAGAALGIFWARAAHSFETKNSNAAQKNYGEWMPVALNDGMGVVWHFEF